MNFKSVFIFITITVIPSLVLALPSVPEIPPFPTIISNGYTYHVDKDVGSNLNNGSAVNPWATLGYGINQLTAGETLIVHGASTPYDEWFQISSAGTYDSWITVIGVDGENGEKVIVQNRLTFNSSAAYMLIKNIDLHGGGWLKLRLFPDSHHLAFDDIEIDCQSSTDNYTGVWVDAGVNNVWFKDMDIHHCGYMKQNPTDCSGVCIKASALPQLVNDIIFINVTARDNKGDGFSTSSNYLTVDSVYFDGCSAVHNTGDGFDIRANRVVFTDSVSIENGPDQGVGFKSWATETWLINCRTYNNEWEAVLYRPYEDNSEIYILNCTFMGDNKEHYGGEIRNSKGFGTNNVYIYNNIFQSINTKAVVFEDVSKQTLAGEDHNYYFSANDPALKRAGETIAFQFRRNKGHGNKREFRQDGSNILRSYTFCEMGDGTWYAGEGLGEHDNGKAMDEDCIDNNRKND